MIESIILKTFVLSLSGFITFAAERELNHCSSDTRPLIRLYLAFVMTAAVGAAISIFQNDTPSLTTVMFLSGTALNLIACKRRDINNSHHKGIVNGKA